MPNALLQFPTRLPMTRAASLTAQRAMDLAHQPSRHPDRQDNRTHALRLQPQDTGLSPSQAMPLAASRTTEDDSWIHTPDWMEDIAGLAQDFQMESQLQREAMEGRPEPTTDIFLMP